MSRGVMRCEVIWGGGVLGGGEVGQGMHTPPAEAVPAHSQEALVLVHHLEGLTVSHKAYAAGRMLQQPHNHVHDVKWVGRGV